MGGQFTAVRLFAGELKKKYEIDEVIKPKRRPKKKGQR